MHILITAIFEIQPSSFFINLKINFLIFLDFIKFFTDEVGECSIEYDEFYIIV